MKNIIIDLKKFYLEQLKKNKSLTIGISILLFILLVIIIPKPLSERKKLIKETNYKGCLTGLQTEKKCKCYTDAYIKRMSNEAVAYRLYIEHKTPSIDNMKQIMHDIFLAELDCVNTK